MKYFSLNPSDSQFEYNKKFLPGLVPISSFEDIRLTKDEFFFLLLEDELVSDVFRPNNFIRVDKNIGIFEKTCLQTKKDVVFVPVRTINYHNFPPKTLSCEIKPRIFKYSAFDINVKLEKNSKKKLYNMVLFEVFKQVSVQLEIGKPLNGDTPKLMELI